MQKFCKMERLYSSAMAFIVSVVPGILIFAHRNFLEFPVWKIIDTKQTTLYEAACYGVNTWLSDTQFVWFNFHVIAGASFAVGLILLKSTFKGFDVDRIIPIYKDRGFAHAVLAVPVFFTGFVICFTGYKVIPRLHPSAQMVVTAEFYTVVTLLIGSVLFATVYKDKCLHVVCARGLVCACAIAIPVAGIQRVMQALGYHFILVKWSGYAVAFVAKLLWIVCDYFVQRRRIRTCLTVQTPTCNLHEI